MHVIHVAALGAASLREHFHAVHVNGIVVYRSLHRHMVRHVILEGVLIVDVQYLVILVRDQNDFLARG